MYYSYGIYLLNTLVIDLNTVLLNTININVFKRVNVMPIVISKMRASDSNSFGPLRVGRVVH